mgnify:CR=1 FL=1
MIANKDTRPTRILIADDEMMFNYGFETLLKSRPDLNIEAETESASIEAVLQKVHDADFDALLLDLDWYGDQRKKTELPTLQAIQKLKEMRPSLFIIAISAFPELIKKAQKDKKADVVLLKREMTPERLAKELNKNKAEQQ